MKTLISQSVITLLVVALALLVYDRLVARAAKPIGVVDVGQVYRLKEAEFTQLVTKSASEAERQQALAMAQRFAQQLPLALEELSHDCECLVLVRSAVAGNPPHALDLTMLLRRKVGLP
ncbi:MAG TPA: hypothetical protein DHV59_10355 [Oxalobacteraceae bacterium]|nr:hypothetical protein [Oxalobacteraceae bacterium]